MYCTNCGTKRKEEEKYCTNCGTKLSGSNTPNTTTIPPINNNGTISLILGIISFVFLSIPPIATILAIISIILGRKFKKETGNRSAGTIIGIIGLILSFVEIIAIIMLMVTFNEYTENGYQEIIPDNYYDNYYDEDYFDEYEDNETESFDINGYSWIGIDKSVLYLNNNKTYIWYQDDQDHNNNFHSGTYEFYTGTDAITYIANNLPEYGLTKEVQENMIETKNYDSKDYYLLILNCNKSIIGNEEQNTTTNKIYYYGFYNEALKQLDLINMTTNTNAQFYIKNKIAQVDM